MKKNDDLTTLNGDNWSDGGCRLFSPLLVASHNMSLSSKELKKKSLEWKKNEKFIGTSIRKLLDIEASEKKGNEFLL